MQFAVMDPADWHREFIADPAGERAWLREPNVMRLGRRATAHDAWLGCDKLADLVDESRKVLCDIGDGFVGHRIDGFDLERFHEALGLGVIEGAPSPAHGTEAGLPDSPEQRIENRDRNGECSRVAACVVQWRC
jgi:hypothetical protein